MDQIVVGMADCRVAAVPGQVLATYALGSCIGLALYDPGAKVGGLIHFMLPDSRIDPARARDCPYMFADTGVALLLKNLCDRGANPRRLVAHAAGGASSSALGISFDVGSRNRAALRDVLRGLRVPLMSEALGGTVSRSIWLEIGSGLLRLREGGAS